MERHKMHRHSTDKIKNIPKDHIVTYSHIVVDYRLQKEDHNRVWITVGRNLIDYPGKLATRTDNQAVMKQHD